MRAILILTAFYTLLTALLLPARPLWLDEVIQLLDSGQPTASAVVNGVPRNPGGVPLTELLQHYSLKITGFSDAKARLTAAFFGIAAVFMTGAIAWKLGLAHPWVAAALFSVFPLTLRYTAEARPYSQALFFSALATYLFLELTARPRAKLAAAYAFVLAVMLYTQPLSILVAAAHCAWAVFRRDWKPAVYGIIAAAAAGVAFLPWYLWAKSQWTETVVAHDFHFVFTAKTPLMLFRELAGAGYWGSAVLLVLCILAAFHPRLSRSTLTLLAVLIFLPIACGLIADAKFDYFIAIRQFLWVLPAVAILAALGMERAGRADVVLALVFVLICGYNSAKYFSSRQENFATAARALVREVQHGACLIVAPPHARPLYEFFEPELKQDPRDCRTTVAAISPHSTEKDRSSLFRTLANEGYSVSRTQQNGGTTLLFLARR